jgi:hypothetical protein
VVTVANFASRGKSSAVCDDHRWKAETKAKYDLTVDRVQPSCGWCTRNGQLCEYKERKKPGLRAGYGKELEQRLGKDKLSELLI